MSEGPIIPKDASPEEKKALKHSGGHGEGHGEQVSPGGDYNLPKHKPFKPDKGYTGRGKGVGDKL
jgi:hypothetical protein